MPISKRQISGRAVWLGGDGVVMSACSKVLTMDRVAVKREQAVCVARGPDYRLSRSNTSSSGLAQGSGGGNRSWFGGGSWSPSPPRTASPSKRTPSPSPSTSPERSSSWFGYRDAVVAPTARKATAVQRKKATDQLKRDVERKPVATD
jgi:hypothetical protein